MIGGGVAVLPEDVGEHVGVNHMQEVFRKGGNGANSGQMPSGSGGLSPILRCCLGALESLDF
jgi:hypothetical protein